MKHGTVGGYTNQMCRCDACSAAHREYMGKYMLKRRAELKKLRKIESTLEGKF